MTISVYQPYQQITVTSRIYRALVQVRKTGATVTCERLPSRDGRCMIMRNLVITGTGSDVRLATNKLDRLINPDLYR